MILEIAQLTVAPGSEAEFEANVGEAAPLFARAKGCHGMELQKSLESPGRYVLLVRWASHTVAFRASEDFLEWRRLVGPFLAGTPEVEHTQEVRLA